MKNQHWNGIEGRTSQGMKASMMVSLGELTLQGSDKVIRSRVGLVKHFL